MGTLLHDFRQRLLGRFASINVAFQEVAGKSGLSSRLRCADFEIALVRIGIDRAEAQALFRVIDDDESGDISLEELQDALRVAAPFTSLAEFWHRLVFEWPEIAACALLCEDEARQRAHPRSMCSQRRRSTRWLYFLTYHMTMQCNSSTALCLAPGRSQVMIQLQTSKVWKSMWKIF